MHSIHHAALTHPAPIPFHPVSAPSQRTPPQKPVLAPKKDSAGPRKQEKAQVRPAYAQSAQSAPAAMAAPTAISIAPAISSLRSPAAAPILAPSSRPISDIATLTAPNVTAATPRLT